jgi:O-antigen/teichoic acid export membrane protein
MLRGVTWNVFGAAFTQGSVFLANIIIANLVGRNVFGEYGMIQSTLVAFGAVAQVATGITATKYVAEFRTVDKERTGRILGLCSAVTLVTGAVATFALVLGAPWLASSLLKSPHLSRGIVISAGFVLLTVMNGYQVGALAGLENYRAIARSGAIQGVFHLAACSLFTYLWGLEGALGGLVAGAFARWYLFHMMLKTAAREQEIPITYGGIWAERGIILRFALPAAISGLSTMPALWLANTFLVRQPGGFSQMGLYSAANTLRTAVIFVPLLVNNVGTSLLNNQRGLGDAVRYRKVFWFNLAATAAVAIAGALAVAATGPYLLRMFGKEFTGGTGILVILMLSTLPESLAIAGAQVVQSQEKMWLSFFLVALPRDICVVALSYYLAPLQGAAGLAWAYTISWVLTLVTVFFMVCFIGLEARARTR